MVIVRYVRFLVICTASFLLLDAAVLLYLNNFYLKDSGSYSVKKISGSVSRASVKKTAIGSAASGLQVSHDGEYLSYLTGASAAVLNLSTGQKISIPAVSHMQLAAFRWIYDRDRLLIAETSTAGYPYYAKLYYFDMSEQKLVEIRDNYNNKEIRISLSGSGDTVTALDMSAETGLTFLKVTGRGTNSTLWESNVMVSTHSLSGAVSAKIGNIACLKMSETLYYEDTGSGEVYRYGSRTPLRISGRADLRILGVDQKDNIYLASMQGDQVDGVWYGNAESGSWSRLDVARPAGLSQFFVTYGGNVWEDEPSAGTIVNLATHKKQGYQGTLAGVFDSGFLTRTGEQITTDVFGG